MIISTPSSRWTLGLLCIISVAFVWTFATVMKRYFISSSGHSSHAAVITCILNSTYTLQFVTLAAGAAFERRRKVEREAEQQHHGGQSENSSTTTTEQQQQHGQNRNSIHNYRIHLAAERGPTIGRPIVNRTLKISLLIFPIWIASQLTYNKGITLTSITTSTIVSSTSIIWTYLASTIVLNDPASGRKSCGVGLCVLGNILLICPQLPSTRSHIRGHAHFMKEQDVGGMFSYGHTHSKGYTTIMVDTHLNTHVEHSTGDHLMGILLCAFSAMGYAAYTTMIKLWIIPDQASLVLFFACIGLYSLTIALPGASLLDPSAFSSSSISLRDLLALLLVGVIDNVLGQYLWAKGVLYTSGTVATVGMSLTVPLSIVADLCQGTSVNGIHFLASVTVIAGFMVIYTPSDGDGDEGDGLIGELTMINDDVVEPLNNPRAHDEPIAGTCALINDIHGTSTAIPSTTSDGMDKLLGSTGRRRGVNNVDALYNSFDVGQG